jgi:hypothetical protein
MSDPWADEWANMTYTEKLNWWWSARSNYQSQEDFAAGKVAAEGVSCKYGIPGFLPGTRTPYNKPVTNPAPEANPATPSETTETTVPATEDSKPVKEATSEESKPATVEETKSTTSTSDDEKKSEKSPGTVNLIIPPGSSTLNVSNNKKKKNKGKNKH